MTNVTFFIHTLLYWTEPGRSRFARPTKYPFGCLTLAGQEDHGEDLHDRERELHNRYRLSVPLRTRGWQRGMKQWARPELDRLSAVAHPSHGEILRLLPAWSDDAPRFLARIMAEQVLMDTMLSGSSQTTETASSPVGDSKSGEAKTQSPVRFVPKVPQSLADLGISREQLEGLILKLLLIRGHLPGRTIADSLHVPRPLVQESLETLRADLLIAIKGAAGIEDYLFQLTEAGDDRARRLAKRCSYSGVAPVPLEDYIAAIGTQSLQGSTLRLEKLRAAFHGLRLCETLLSQMGQAVNDGRGLFLYGPPGNGKTSISELVVSAFGEYVWIPHTIAIDGEMVRLYDPRSHEAVDAPEIQQVPHDRRWILIHRPTIVVGGELTMEQLDLQYNRQTGICEAPVQLRANGGALVIDDLGRQRMHTSALLNRLIVPMEKHLDYLNLPSGRQVSVPFDMLTVFSTNLEPRDLVDEAFLRRIPYKIEVKSPNVDEFVELFLDVAAKQGLTCERSSVDSLLDQHYAPYDRPLRYCHPRDLIRQIKNFCEFHDREFVVDRESIDVAVRNYFAGL